MAITKQEKKELKWIRKLMKNEQWTEVLDFLHDMMTDDDVHDGPLADILDAVHNDELTLAVDLISKLISSGTIPE